MACAAWETALRYYLATVASNRDSECVAVSKRENVPTLEKLATAARGGPLFYDWIDKASGFERHGLEVYRQRMQELRGIRNELLHEGEAKLHEMAATDPALAVLSAIEWLFEGA